MIIIGRYNRQKSRPLVILLAGLPGTGKSTIARRVMKRYNLEHISTDSVRKRIFRNVKESQFGKDHYTENNRIIVYDTIFYVLYTLLRNGVGCVLDGTFYLSRLRTKVKRICERFNGRFVLVHVTCPEEVIVKRFKERQKRQKRTLSDANLEIYRQLKKEFEPIMIPYLSVDVRDGRDKILELIHEKVREQTYSTRRY